MTNNQNLQELQSEWDQLREEVEQIQAEYNILCRQRSAFQVQLMFPENNSPEALATFQQQATEQVGRWSVNLKELNQNLRSTRVRLKKKRTQMIVKQTQIYRIQARQQWPSICQQANDINRSITEVQQKLQALKQISHDYQPQVYQWLPPHPELVQVDDINFPVLVRQENHWAMEYQTMNWNEEYTE
jgi:chromosome segregation ATPase